jgi:hypothetical protein
MMLWNRLVTPRLWLSCVACLTFVAPPAFAQACDTAHFRWQAKTTTALVRQVPQRTSVSTRLTRWTIPPVGPGPSYWCAPRVERERQVYAVEGWLRFADTTKDDGDWHLELTEQRDDPAERCIVVEIPDPRFGDIFRPVRSTVDTLLRSSRWTRSGRLNPPVHVRVIGPAFFDAEHIHGHKRIRAEGHGHCNGSLLALWEIHPAYRIEHF